MNVKIREAIYRNISAIEDNQTRNMSIRLTENNSRQIDILIEYDELITFELKKERNNELQTFL